MAYNSLLETYKQIAEEMPLFETASTLISESSYLQKAIVMVFEDIIEFHVFALKFFKGRGMIHYVETSRITLFAYH